jgi:copper resistance protein D
MRGVYLASVWLHILAAMTWVGGMVVFVAAVMPYYRRRPEAEKAEFLEWFGDRFRRVAWTCFAILLATGTFNLWVRGVRLTDLFRPEWRATSFGSVVVMKLALVAIAVGVSAAHESVMTRVGVSAAHESVMTRAYARWMGRLLLLIGLAIVLMAVLLVRAQ